MGAQTFRLDDYYRFVFSPNIPLAASVPEPSTALLLCVGLVGALALARRSRKKQNGVRHHFAP